MGTYYIIGAGLSGLRIGQLLASSGKRVEIFEKDNQAGGLMKTEKRNGFLFDIGPHIFFKNYAQEYRNLIGKDLHNIKVRYGVGFKNKDIASPIRPNDLFKNLGFKQSLPMVWDILRHKPGNGGYIDNAEEWAISNFGKEAYKRFFKDYIPKVMGLPATMVTKEWGTERHKFYKEHNLKSTKLLVNFLANKENQNGCLDVYYPEHGARQIPDAICKEVLKFGGNVHLRTVVDKIEVCKGGVSAIVIERDGVKERIEIKDGSVVINTMPITSLFKALASTNGDINDVKRVSQDLKYRNLRLFNLVVKRKRLKSKAQIYFPEAKYIFKRVYEPKNLQREPGDNSKTAICVEVCYNKWSESMGEQEMYSRVLWGLKDFYNICEGDVLDMWSKNIPFAYSIYELGYKENLSRLVEYLFNLDNLISFGRQGGFKYNHMTNRVMDTCNTLHNYLKSGIGKKKFLTSPDLKSDFF